MIENAATMFAELRAGALPAHVVEGVLLEAQHLSGLNPPALHLIIPSPSKSNN
jgi:hypothetical protein